MRLKKSSRTKWPLPIGSHVQCVLAIAVDFTECQALGATFKMKDDDEEMSECEVRRSHRWVWCQCGRVQEVQQQFEGHGQHSLLRAGLIQQQLHHLTPQQVALQRA